MKSEFPQEISEESENLSVTNTDNAIQRPKNNY